MKEQEKITVILFSLTVDYNRGRQDFWGISSKLDELSSNPDYTFKTKTEQRIKVTVELLDD